MRRNSDERRRDSGERWRDSGERRRDSDERRRDSDDEDVDDVNDANGLGDTEMIVVGGREQKLCSFGVRRLII